MALTCRTATRVSLAALGGHAAEAERLELEGHLATCQRCSDEHSTALGMVRRLGDVEPEPLGATAEEAVRRALAAGQPASAASARRSPWPLRAGAALAVAAAAIVVLFAWRDRPYRVIDGDVVVEAAAAAAAETDAGQGPVLLRSVAGGRVRITDATVDLGSATEMLWNGHRRTAELRRGRITVDVEHQVGRHLQIRTARFTVEVVGTRFTVDAGGVHTERGVVRVLRPDGSVAARVEAGGRWSADALSMREATAAGERAPATAPPHPTATGAAERVRAPAAVAPAGGSLGGARRALARGDAQAARRIVEGLFHLGRDVAVEARVIFAESFLVEGRYADAIDGYRLVVRDFPATEQAEIALFAIAQLEAAHGPRSQARAALQAYVARYPHGRFVREATERLGQLASRER